MALDIVFLMAELIFLAFSAYIQFILYKKWLDDNNRIDIYIIIYFIVLQINSIYLIIQKATEITLVVGEALTLTRLFVLFIVTTQLQIFLYVVGDERFYTLPHIFSIFLVINLIIADIGIYIFLYTFILDIFLLLLLILLGHRNQSGMIITLGFFIFLYGVSSSFTATVILFGSLFKIFAAIIFTIGILGYVEKYFFVDEEHEKAVKSTWISKLVDEKK
ncbi:MAG: hypothetical protein GF317_08870 [Candidatus Lokiarchaeota archaeon]|nr:hypothetical protein [Candidatus Lokiarchaeota archaeon]MBD3199823.1 hypothetical protein [Candidatus Lokiarchaeota archaeon]